VCTEIDGEATVDSPVKILQVWHLPSFKILRSMLKDKSMPLLAYYGIAM
jgi:hypothetical protein